MPQIVQGGSRSRTFDLFETAIANPRSGRVPLLLVDSEGPVEKERSVCRHLQAWDNWNPPDGLADDQTFLMVQVMETWFLADRATLKKHLGERFRENAIRRWPHLEDVPKATVLSALRSATKNCSSPYAKGKVSFELLEKIDPGLVETACPHAKALLERLRRLE